MTSKRPTLSLRSRIIAWSFFPALTILLAVALINYFAYQRVTQDLVVDRNRELTRLSAGRLTSDLAVFSDALTSLAESPGMAYGLPVQQAAGLESAKNQLVGFDGGVLIVNSQGYVTAATPDRAGLVGQSWPHRDFFGQVLRTSDPIFSDLLFDGEGKPEAIALAVPMFATLGEFRGAVVGLFRIDEDAPGSFQGRIVRLRLNEGGDTYLVDSAGRVIYHSRPELIGSDLRGEISVQRVMADEVAAFRTVDLERREILASFAPVPGTPWGLVSEESWASLLAPSRTYRISLLVLLALGVIVPALMAGIGTRRITRPVTALLQAAKEMAGGKLGAQISLQTGDELEDLVRQFNSMSTQLKQTYNLLNEQQEQLQLVMWGTNDGIWDWDLRTNQVYYSARWKNMLGYEEDEVENTYEGWHRLIHPEDVDRAEATIRAHFEGETPFYSLEHRLRHKDGSYRWILARGMVLRDAEGNPYRMAGSHTDLTERRQAEEKIRRQNEYLAGLHETTLGVVSRLGLMELLETVVERALRLVDAPSGFLYLVDPEKGDLEVKVAAGLYRKYAGMRLQRGEGLSGKIWRDNRSMAVDDYSTWPGRSAQAGRDPLGPMMGVPLRSAEEVVGVIGLGRTTSSAAFGEDELRLLERFGQLASIALDNARLHTSLRDELTERARAQEALRARLEFEGLITSISTEFINLRPDEFDAGIQRALEAIGQFTGSDRSYLFRYSPDGATMTNTHEWCRAGVPPLIGLYQEQPVQLLPWTTARLRHGEVVHVRSIESLPPEADIDRLRFLSHAPPTTAILNVPMTYRGEVVGLLGFDAVGRDKTWTEDSIPLLRIASEVFINAMESQRVEGVLRASEERFRAAFDGAPFGAIVTNLEGRIVEANKAWQDMHGYSKEEARCLVIQDYTHPDDLAADPQFFKKLTEDATGTGQLAMRFMRKDGSQFWGRLSASLAYGGRGEPLFAIVMTEDITAEKEADEQLAEAYQTLEQRVEERTHELSTLHSISEVVSRSLDLREIMGSALDQLSVITGVERGAAFRLQESGEVPTDGQTLALIAWRGLSSEVRQVIQSLPLQDTLLSKAAATGQPVAWKASDYTVPGLRQALEEQGVQMGITVPLLAKGRVVGALVLGTDLVRPVEAEELSLLASVGQQVGLAVENARLYEAEREGHEEAERRRQVAEALREILSTINSSRSLEEILDHIVSQARRLLGSDAIALYRLDPESRTLHVSASEALDPYYAARMVVPVGKGAVGQAVRTRQPVVVANPEDTVASLLAGWPDDPEWRALLNRMAARYRTLLGVPLTLKDEAFGALALYFESPRDFADEDVRLAVTFADQAALAIETARLRDQAREIAIVAERSRLARDLHDAVTQSLYSVTLYAEAAARLLASGKTAEAADHLREVRDTAQEALKEMRLLIFQLRPPALEKGDLPAALQTRLDAVELRGGTRAELDVEGAERANQVPPAIQEEIYHIALEALNNILRHAKAQSVLVTLKYLDDETLLQVADDGIGFHMDLTGRSGGLGLQGMRERAHKIGGRLEIESSPQRGTRIRLEVPRAALARPPSFSSIPQSGE